jgi:hypothetical protein
MLMEELQGICPGFLPQYFTIAIFDGQRQTMGSI